MLYLYNLRCELLHLYFLSPQVLLPLTRGMNTPATLVDDLVAVAVPVRGVDRDAEPGVDRGVDRPAVVEWQTILVALSIFSAYGLLTWFHRSVPTWILIPALGYVLTWSGSLQHEIIHGHPTKWPRFNRFIGRFTLDLWSPFEHYRQSHLQHHRDELLTDPRTDAESFYVTPEQWAQKGRATRAVFWFYRTLLGRLLLAPIFTLTGYLREQAAQAIKGVGVEGEGCPRKRWLGHLPFVCITVAWLTYVGFSPYVYMAVIYLSISGIRLRSFVEHRWMPDGKSKTATVHAAAPFALLFLNNNLHTAHHFDMRAAWYRLPKLSTEINADAIAADGAGLYSGYFDVARRYGVKPFDQPVFPG
jgi:fatty acid desaturase